VKMITAIYSFLLLSGEAPERSPMTLTSLIASASPSACNILVCLMPSAFLSQPVFHRRRKFLRRLHNR